MTVLLGILVVVLNAAGQMLLKIGARRRSGHNLINRYVAAGYVLFFLVVLFSYFLMHVIELKYFAILMSMNYVAVAIAARFVLGEEISKQRAIGTLFIVAGVSVFLMR